MRAKLWRKIKETIKPEGDFSGRELLIHYVLSLLVLLVYCATRVGQLFFACVRKMSARREIFNSSDHPVL